MEARFSVCCHGFMARMCAVRGRLNEINRELIEFLNVLRESNLELFLLQHSPATSIVFLIITNIDRIPNAVLVGTQSQHTASSAQTSLNLG